MHIPQLLALVIIVGGGILAIFSLRREALKQATREELDELRRQMVVMEQNMEARFADLTLMIDDVLKRSLPHDTSPPDPSEPREE